MAPLRSTIINTIDTDDIQTHEIERGWNAVRQAIAGYLDSNPNQDNVRIALDGYLSVDWERVRDEMLQLERYSNADTMLIDTSDCKESEEHIKALVDSSLPEGEPVFGTISRLSLSDFFDPGKLAKVERSISSKAKVRKTDSARQITIYFGSGAALPPFGGNCDLKFFFDVTREKALKRNKAWNKKKSKTQSISPRQIYYVDFPVNDRHRKKILGRCDYYIDTNTMDEPVILPVKILGRIIEKLLEQPLRIKPLYERGVWGGQWLKKNRGLPNEMKNCAYGFEIIAPEQSLLISVGETLFELPFNLLMERAIHRIMTPNQSKRYGNVFPVRISYDDTWMGDNLSIQVHPGSKYIRQNFGEKMHQAEMYYMFDAMPGSVVHLGVQEDAEKEPFFKAARRSETERKGFDHTRFVNVFPAEKGSIYLIPPGTVHGAGANELVLEISSTPYRYTFKIYDYLRPDLDGGFRPIHTKHAFNVIKFFRREKWVRKNLIPRPVLFAEENRDGTVWREYTIADCPEFYHIVHRFEFDKYYEDETAKGFHLLSLVEGDSVSVTTLGGRSSGREMAFSETLLLPKAVGPYRVTNLGKTRCKVLKTFLRV